MQATANKTLITLPRPHAAQDIVIANAVRFNVVVCGRRWGKTTLGINRCITPDVLDKPVGWFSIDYKNMLEVWREVVEIVRPIIKRKSIQERRIDLITGGVIEFWSLDSGGDSVRGRKYARVIIDEAAKVPGLLDIWQQVIRPTLVDYSGDAWFLSTPFGRNGFWRLYQLGLDDTRPEWSSWQMPTSANPHIPASEIDDLARDLPEDKHRQEILAAFLEDGGGVFRNVLGAVVDDIEPGTKPNSQYIFGVDWGKYTDFTVITVLDITTNTVIEQDRFNQIDYAVQRGRLMALAERYRPTVVIAESNSMGDAVIEQLQRDGIPVQPFVTTNATKKQIIDGLALAFERGSISIPDNPVLIAELQAYEMERTAHGNYRYNAPSGMHDDAVISLALAWHGMSRYQKPASNEIKINPAIYKSSRANRGMGSRNGRKR